MVLYGSAWCCNFNSIKVQLSPGKPEVHARLSEDFNSIKVQLSLMMLLCSSLLVRYFNSIKVQLSPIALGYIISLFPIGFANAKLRNLIEKMSMGNHIFSYVLRQPLFFIVLQQVKDLNEASERVVCRLKLPHRQLFVTRNCRLTFSLSQVFVCPYYNLYYL